MVVIATFFLTALVTTVAQMPPPGGPGAMPAQPPLESGYCLDSARPVPKVLVPPASHATQIVRIDQVVSTATMLAGEIIGFLYTTADGTTWLAQRSGDYISPASATAINQVLASTRLPGENVKEFPPTSRYGVSTKEPRFFKVRITPDAQSGLRFQLVPCVVWPAGRVLPDPTI